MGNTFNQCLSCKSEESEDYFDIYEENRRENNDLGLKIHVLGNLPEKEQVIRDIFKNSITDRRYRTMGTHEYKTDQFYWIAKNYLELSEKTMENVCEEIKKDKDLNTIKCDKNVILFFGSENLQLLLEKLKENGDVYFPFIIIISEENNKPEIKGIDLRKITYIVLNDKTTNRLNNIIISQLWEYDCYYNELGNKICRYTPDNIFKALNINIPFYSINILLTGKSRSGKSTFINCLSNKLVARESSDKISVTQKITEYCLELNNNGQERSTIKLFDTPGIVPEANKLKECVEFLRTLLENKDNNLEKQIHLILFFFLEGESLEGINEIFNLLNNCQKPVLFVINKAFDESDNGNTKDIKSTISFLTKYNFNNLMEPKNLFGVNLIKTKKSLSFGIEDIFKRIHKIFKEKNNFNEECEQQIEKLYKNYENIYEKPQELQTKERDKNDFQNEVLKFKNDISKQIDMYKNLDVDKIIESGKKSVKKCNKVINSLGNISNIIQSIDKFIPAISYFQSFMVIEIGEIYGFNLKEMNKEINAYLRNLEENLKDMDNLSYEKIKENNDKKIKISNEIIEKQLKSELGKSNKDIVGKLSELFLRLRQSGIEENNFSEKNIDEALTNGICEECQEYLINQLKNSEGVIFYKNYMKICKQLEKDLENFSNKDTQKDWGKKEMIVIEE